MLIFLFTLKVVGGMTWCITNCTVAIDVDLLFQENSTIGQKIALTEKIVSALRKMVCPMLIEPHQIQGSDWKNIFPVVQWLVKKVIETREIMGDNRRAYSISQFDKKYKLPSDYSDDQIAKIKSTINKVKNHYKPVRKYKRVDDVELTTEEAKVSSTLLEYGRISVVGQNKKTEKTNESKNDKQKNKIADQLKSVESALGGGGGPDEVEVNEEEDIRVAQEKILQKLMGGMSEMTGREAEGKVASRVVGSIVGMQSNEIQKISDTFAKKKAEIEEAAREALLDPVQELKNNIESLEGKKGNKVKEICEVNNRLEQVSNNKSSIKEELDGNKELQEAIKQEFDRLEEIEANAERADVKEIRELVMLNEKMKKDEVAFKANCKSEMTRMKELIKKLQEQIQHRDEVGTENDEIVKKQLETDTKKLNKVRRNLAAKSRTVNDLSRKIDEVPSRAELTQYQKRFVELYDQIAVTHVETKQFYSAYNTLEDCRFNLQKEADLLDSIYDNFQTARSSQHAMQQYLKQFEQIVEGVRANHKKFEAKRSQEKAKRDERNEQYQQLVDKDRMYVKTIREFQEECRKNEILVSKLQAI